MTRKAKATIVVLSTLILYLCINSLSRILKPTAFLWYEEDKEERSWIASSRFWLDRKSCRWLGVCGAAHFQTADAQFGHHSSSSLSGSNDTESEPWRSFWFSGVSNRSKWDAEEWARREIPGYVFDYAPLVHLYSGEQFWPGDIAEHLNHTNPMLNYTPVQTQWDHPTLKNLDDLNQWEGGRHVFLTTVDDVQSQPPWLEDEKNIPESDEETKESWADWDGRLDGKIPGDTELDCAKWFGLRNQKGEDKNKDSSQSHRLLKQELRKGYGGKEIQDPLQDTPTNQAGARSDAPAILLLMDKGNAVINMRFGNHIGNWEHCLVRFYDGQPKALFFSAHTAGEAYRYEAIEKIGQRPVIYSAKGSHAMYATAGVHEYILPWGLLHDVTDRGPLWDPLLNSHAYTYDFDNDALRASTFNPASPTEWFHFRGHWGDKFYQLSDSRQYRFAGQYHYVNGPLGPRFKHLNRRKVCQGPDSAPCVIKDWIGEDKRSPRWDSVGFGE
ncbi:uncharacterized protein N7498_001935 [Penicillium cinerascens]|uniref:Uncharacterized protein n=1 Tax=Penicillium cinerascens TaxID=70096 RepID=A0A9W9NAL4_9EURO|nr:uncharacterized protein N7498_001935 [Penicillium cinerascens]KAJ5215528.1 hypothetical protein N7498_001935 [Penicillium cinerascens]